MTEKITNDVIARKLFLPDPEECYRIIRQTRWPKGVTCPYCGSKEVQKNGHTPKGAQKYHCKNCGKYFNDLTGTAFSTNSQSTKLHNLVNATQKHQTHC